MDKIGTEEEITYDSACFIIIIYKQRLDSGGTRQPNNELIGSHARPHSRPAITRDVPHHVRPWERVPHLTLCPLPSGDDRTSRCELKEDGNKKKDATRSRMRGGTRGQEAGTLFR